MSRNLQPSSRCEVCDKWYLEHHGIYRLRPYCIKCYVEWQKDEEIIKHD